MRVLRSVVAAISIAAVLSFVATVSSIGQHKPRHPNVTRADTHVYLMRGLFGVFSLGMDDLAGKLNNRGFSASVYGYDVWQTIADQIVQRRQNGHTGPVVIIGHSLGANATFDVANSLNTRDVPVQLGVIFDATEVRQVPANVTTFINFYAKDGFGHRALAGPGFLGELDNFDLTTDGTITHTNIDALDRFHQLVIDKLMHLTRP
jgi:pimeloyl-ACP methyl ester carboxylesterase